MREVTTKVMNQEGIHMRPGVMLMDIANSFESDIIIATAEAEADATSIMQITMLAAIVGTELTIKADGPDEDEAVKAIVDIIEDGFQAVYAEK